MNIEESTYQKCGEIFLTNEKTYTFLCVHCDELFYEFNDFKEHSLQHLSSFGLEFDEGTIATNSTLEGVQINFENNISDKEDETNVDCKEMQEEVLDENNDTVENIVIKTENLDVEENDINEETPILGEEFVKVENSNKTRSPQSNFNDAAIDCINSVQLSPSAETNTKGNSMCSDKQNQTETVEIQSLEESNLTSVLRVLAKNQNTIMDNQNMLSNRMNDLENLITAGLARTYTEIQSLVKMQNTFTSVSADVSCPNTTSTFAIEAFDKISCLETAQNLDEKLKKDDFKSDMIQKMAYIIGKNGRRVGQGWTCCYELVDCIFERSFLVLCSWTGASTSKSEDGKIAFLGFKNLISCFANIIINADPEFSLESTKQFFKKLLRNSTRFLIQEQQQSRKSVKRERHTKNYPGKKLCNKEELVNISEQTNNKNTDDVLDQSHQ